MDRFIYITPEQARVTHEKTIQYSGGGTLEELDFGKLESVLYNIQNDDWYPTFVDKLTHLFSVPASFIVLPMGISDLRLRCLLCFFYSTVIYQ